MEVIINQAPYYFRFTSNVGGATGKVYHTDEILVRDFRDMMKDEESAVFRQVEKGVTYYFHIVRGLFFFTVQFP